jgi:hypothetical protein
VKKLTFFLFSLIFLLSANGASANSGFELAPKNFFLQAYPGKTIREVVTLKNLEATPKTVSLTWQGYQLTGSESTSDVDRNNHSINFARLSTKKLELQPQSTAAVEIEFAVPKDIQPADYYGSLLAASESLQTQADFTVRVLGKVEEKIAVTGFSVKGDDIILKIANHGNQTTSFQANLKIQDLLGRAKDLEPIKDSLKAAEAKTFQVKHSSGLPGPYQAKISLDFGTSGQRVAFYSFWIRPEVFLIFGAIILIAAFIFLSKLRRRK